MKDDGAKLGFRLTLPAQVLVLFISVFPLLMQLYISLTDWSPLAGTSWTQAWAMWNTFANYIDLIYDHRLWSALGRTAFGKPATHPRSGFFHAWNTAPGTPQPRAPGPKGASQARFRPAPLGMQGTGPGLNGLTRLAAFL